MDTRIQDIEDVLHKFDRAGDLRRLRSIDDLRSLQRPAVGGIALLEPLTLPALIITLGGLMGAGKSVYDFYAHADRIQQLRSTSWRIATRIDRLKSELVRRGIPW